MYEYYDRVDREEVIEFKFEQEADKIEEETEKETFDWIEEEERKEKEAAKKANEEKWMLEQLKKEHGDDFGDDINLDFSE